MRERYTLRTRIVGGVVAAVAAAGLAMPAAAQAATGPAGESRAAAAGDVSAAASWRTISTYRTSLGCQGEKLKLERTTPWVLRCQSAGAFTHHLQRYS